MNKINWYNYVDHIFCINYLPNKRKLIVSNEFQRVGIPIYDNTIFTWEYSTNSFEFFKDYIIEYANKKLSPKNGFNCIFSNDYPYKAMRVSLNNYRIMKIALELGYKKIMIFEDDARFLKNIHLINKIYENIPNDSNLTVLAPTYEFDNYNDLINRDLLDNSTTYFMKRNNIRIGIYSSLCNIYDEIAMKNYIERTENICYTSPDFYYLYPLDINIYFTKIPIAVQSNVTNEILNIDNFLINNYNLN